MFQHLGEEIWEVASEEKREEAERRDCLSEESRSTERIASAAVLGRSLTLNTCSRSETTVAPEASPEVQARPRRHESAWLKGPARCFGHSPGL